MKSSECCTRTESRIRDGSADHRGDRSSAELSGTVQHARVARRRADRGREIVREQRSGCRDAAEHDGELSQNSSRVTESAD